MSNENPAAPQTGLPLSEEQLNKIGGGDCTPLQIQEMLGKLRESYDSLIDFTSYVIERVVGP